MDGAKYVAARRVAAAGGAVMNKISWAASAAMHTTFDNSAFVGTLEDCCQRYCEMPQRERSSCYVLCEDEIVIDRCKMPKKIEGVNLNELALEFVFNCERKPTVIIHARPNIWN
jgi:hypothetical protein